MSVRALLDECRQRGVELILAGDEIKVRAPKGALTPELVSELRRTKPELVAFLKDARFSTGDDFPPIQAVSDQDTTALSLAQERVWELSQGTPQSAVYNLPAVLSLSGAVDRQALDKSFRTILERHQILRATVDSSGGHPKLRVQPLDELPAELIQLIRSDEGSSPQELLRRLVRTPLEPGVGPLYRIQLLETAHEHYLALTLHHLVADGWSFDVLFRELELTYDALIAGLRPALPMLPIQYVDYAHWERKVCAGNRGKAQQEFWGRHLGEDALPTLAVPQRNGTHRATDRAGCQQFEIDVGLSKRLKKLCAEQRASFFVGLLAAFQTTLFAFNQQEHSVVCTTIAGRDMAETKPLIGYFNKVLPVRTNMTGDPTFQEVLERIRIEVSLIYENSLWPIQEIANLPSLARTNLARCMFMLRPTLQPPRLRGVDATLVHCDNGAADFDLEIDVQECGETVFGEVTYKSDLFSSSAITDLIAVYLDVLRRAVTDPHERVSRLCGHVGVRVSHLEPPGVGSRPSPTVGPRPAETKLERELTGMWQEALGLRELSVSDDFFELGGHSFSAIRLLSMIEARYGRKLPLATLIEAPTIERLAGALAEPGWVPPWRTLVPIQPHGDQWPLFCVHPIGGNVLHYSDLGRHLAPDQPVYGIQPKGLDGSTPFATIEEMAGHYVQAMREKQPVGPYRLAGSSFGGIVAYEMTRQLEEEGQCVGLLALLDTWGPGYGYSAGFSSWRQRLSRDVVDRLANHASNYWHRGSIDRWRYLLDVGAKALMMRARRQKVPPAIIQVRRANNRALDVYEIVPLQTKVTLLRASKQPCGFNGDPTLGWGSVTQQLEIVDVPGYHGECCLEPYAGMLAAQLRERLESEGRAASVSA